ncbi:hypothetical protein VSWAT3_14787 [Vibrionales bacterium SWAT-3]|nr:hypothetical protein VSWAT3_14787 [Vibrionales bacterium SWAT-3]
MGQPFRIRSTPSNIAMPTDNATVKRRPSAYSSISSLELGITPPSAATSAASAATAVNAGSAMVVPNPRQKAKINNQNTLPLRAKACAIDSPIGKSPISSPKIKKVSPKTTSTKPAKIDSRCGSGSCKTASWKNAITATIGNRSRRLPNIVRNKASTAVIATPYHQ